MRALAITENITVDGSIEMLKGWFDPKRWARPSRVTLLEEAQRQGRRGGCLARRPADVRGLPEYWPKQTDDMTGISDYLNQVRKYLASDHP